METKVRKKKSEKLVETDDVRLIDLGAVLEETKGHLPGIGDLPEGGQISVST